MLTAWCLFVAFGSPWVAGTPFVWLLRGCRRLQGPDWLLVPFVGLAVIICPLQTLVVFADWPLSRIVPGFWVALAVPWGVFVASPSGRASFRTLPVRTLLLSASVYLILGAGLLQQGVENFRGKLQTDQYHYVLLAQTLTDAPFSTDWGAEGGRPWLALTNWLKSDRLGQSVAHGFFAVTAGREAVDLFFPALYLSGALSVLALRMLASRAGLFGRSANAAALVAALVPGAGTLVSECFLSHALFVPTLLAFVAVVARAVRRPSALLVAAILFALGFSVYTEFTPVLLGAGAATALTAVAARQVSWQRAALAATVPVAGVLLNPAATGAAQAIAYRAVGQEPVLDPGQTYWMMLQSVWLDLVTVTAYPAILGAIPKGPVVAMCFGLAALGWIRCARASSARRAAVLGGVVSLMLLPVALFALAPGLRYGIFKLLLTAAPLYALGVCLVARGWRLECTAASRARQLVVAVVVVGFVGDTVRYQQNLRRKHEVLMAAEWNSPELRRVAERLRAEPPGEVVLALGSDEYTWIASGALLYHARQHHIRIESPRQVWLIPLEKFPARLDLTATGLARPGALVVTRPEYGAQAPGEVLLRTERYLLVRAGGRPDAFARGR